MAKILSIVFILVFQSGIALSDFSPDGKQIVFSSNVGNGSQIFISNADGKIQNELVVKEGVILTRHGLLSET